MFRNYHGKVAWFGAKYLALFAPKYLALHQRNGWLYFARFIHVGEIENIWQPANGDIAVNFSYNLNQKYTESEKIGEYRGKLKIGERYIVKVPEGYPERGVMLFQYPVSDSIVPPPGGWNDLPKFVLIQNMIK
jgi:hypothetical protein